MENKPQPKFDNYSVNSAHKRQVTWQIGIPLAVFCLLILAIAFLLVYTSYQQQSPDLTTSWSSISFIFLAIPVILIGFLGLILLSGLIFAISKGIKKVPQLFVLIEYYISIGLSQLAVISNRSVEPIIKFQSWKAILNKFSKIIKKFL